MDRLKIPERKMHYKEYGRVKMEKRGRLEGRFDSPWGLIRGCEG